MAFLITLEKPSKNMVKDALQAGEYAYQDGQHRFKRIQILTIEELLAGKRAEFWNWKVDGAWAKQAQEEATQAPALPTLPGV